MTADLRSQLQSTLGATYSIVRELGGGGMSRVFVARDEALGRDVVVKIIAPGVAEGLSAERFAREIKLAARLQQANIVPVLTAGTSGGLPYYTMPFVRGESLRARLASGAPLPIAEAVSILRDVARALAYAHAEGVVHRDIKPDNILLSGGAAVVTDFGIAKAIDASRTLASGGATGITRAGMSLGTPAYMAPEQALGDPATDHRADIYSWGVVAWELLGGAHPFADKHDGAGAHRCARGRGGTVARRTACRGAGAARATRDALPRQESRESPGLGRRAVHGARVGEHVGGEGRAGACSAFAAHAEAHAGLRRCRGAAARRAHCGDCDARKIPDASRGGELG